MPAWTTPQSMKMGTTTDENDSPPLEGCRGGLFQTERTHPSREGIFTGETRIDG